MLALQALQIDISAISVNRLFACWPSNAPSACFLVLSWQWHTTARHFKEIAVIAAAHVQLQLAHELTSTLLMHDP